MRNSRQLGITLICAVFVIFTCAGIFINRISAPRVRVAAGGSYVGFLPGHGQVRFHIFSLALSDCANGWLYQEGTGLANGLIISSNANGLHTDLMRNEITNAILNFQILNSGQVLRGEITLRNSETPERFILSKTFEHRTLSSSSPFYIPRVGVKFESIGEFPSFGETSFFRKALNERIISECTSSSKKFNSGSLRENWDLISSGVSTFTRHYTYQEQWQVRLETESVASFAVWVAPDWGSCGNPTKWAGRNFCWREGNLNEIKLEDLFRSGTGWEEKIRRWCRADLRRRGLGRASQSLSPATSIDVFTLIPTGLQIYFNPYILGSGADGEFVVHIPFALLRKFLQEDGVAGSIWPLQKKEPRGA